jgi:dipeptidyl aminopeptidase/acylaminoacyl peptidase
VSPGGRAVVLGGDDSHPYELSAVEKKGLRALTSHNAWLAAKRLAKVEDIAFRSADGTLIEGFVVKPPDYQPGRRYPTIMRLHGGPAYQFSHEFMPDWQAYAAAGFVVVAPNPRGSSGRGFDFSRAIYADWGHKDVEDVLAAVDYAVAEGIADPQRLGVGGRSYGGILTNYVIASDTRFKAAVSGAGASNMFGMYGHDEYSREYELELGTPWKNPEAYARVSYPFLHADRIRTATLFYCAGEDFNVPCLGAEQMYQALRSQEVPTQLVIYPGENHDIKVPSHLRDRLERLIGWYSRFLGP